MVGRRHAARIAAVALVAGLGLTGCGSVSNPGSAAKVGDETISVSYLQKQSKDILAKAGRTDLGDAESTQLQGELLQQLIDDQVIVEAGRREGVTATQADVDKVRAEMTAQQVVLPPDMVDGFARYVAIRRTLSTKLLGRTPASQQDQAMADQLVGQRMSAAAKEIGVQVNPRYGTWSGTTLRPDGQLVKSTPSSAPAAVPAPKAP